MKNFCIIVLCISLSVASILFALNGRYRVINVDRQSEVLLCKYDSLTGKTWNLRNADKALHWVEIKEYGYVYLPPEDKKK